MCLWWACAYEWAYGHFFSRIFYSILRYWRCIFALYEFVMKCVYEPNWTKFNEIQWTKKRILDTPWSTDITSYPNTWQLHKFKYIPIYLCVANWFAILCGNKIDATHTHKQTCGRCACSTRSTVRRYIEYCILPPIFKIFRLNASIWGNCFTYAAWSPPKKCTQQKLP